MEENKHYNQGNEFKFLTKVSNYKINDFLVYILFGCCTG